jgi:phosphoglycolate phosphatase
MKCAQTVFEHFGMQAPDRRELRSFVGPPLYKSFEKFGIPNDKIDEAIKVYRKRYNTVGKFENRLYDNIEILLSKLKNDGHRLFIATAKPQTVSVEILRLSGILEKTVCVLDLYRCH